MLQSGTASIRRLTDTCDFNHMEKNQGRMAKHWTRFGNIQRCLFGAAHCVGGSAQLTLPSRTAYVQFQ